MSSTQEIYIRGLRDLKDGALLLIIASIVSITVSIVLYVYLSDIETYLLPTVLENPMEIQRIYGYLEGLVVVVLIALVAGIFTLIIQLIAIFAKIVPGASKLAKADPDYTTSSTLIKVGYVVGLIISVIGFMVLILAIALGIFTLNIPALILGVLGGLVLIIVSYIFFIIGYIGFILLGFKLGEKEAQSEYTIIAVLFIISLVFSFISILFSPVSIVSEAINLVAFILLYSALSKTIEKKRTMLSTPPIYHQAGPPPI